MCGITGSVKLEIAHDLYMDNIERGGFGSGFLAVNQDRYILLKSRETFSLDYLKEQLDGFRGWYYLFHSRAPTNTDSQWDVNATHPFVYRDWVVAQNGIISNAENFRKEFSFQVDTQLIPFHIHQNMGKISTAFEQYEGLLTSWAYDSYSDFLYLIKGGSTLFLTEDSFSSKPFERATAVEDGTIWCFNKKWTPAGTFQYNNPYFL